MVSQILVTERLKILKISDPVKLHYESHEKLLSGINSRRLTQVETKTQRGIFQGDSFSPQLLVIAMMPLNYILRKFKGGCKFTKSQEKMNNLMYIDDIKIFTKNSIELETDTNNKNIQPGYRNGIWQ